MKLLTLSFFVLITLVSTLTRGEDNRRDGNWWTSGELVAKRTYIVGFFDALPLGGRFSYWNLARGTKAEKACISSAMDSYNVSSKYFENVTSGQLVDGLDAFYSDFKNRKIIVSNAIWVVVKQIAGVPEAEINVLIENMRQNAGKFD